MIAPLPIDRPLRAVLLLGLLQIAAWTLLPTLVSTAPPLDVVEGYMWGREWQILTYKHPQLPAWLLEAARLLTGSVAWPHYALSQFAMATAFLFVFLAGRAIAGPQRALAGTLLMPTLYVFGWTSQQFNHDIAQMPFWAGLVWALWRAVERNSVGAWLVVGLIAGVGFHAKFSVALLVGFCGLWMLVDAKARSRLATLQPYLGLALFLALIIPLATALVEDDFLPFRYAEARAEAIPSFRSPFYFAGVQIAGHAGLALVFALTGLLWLGRERSGERAAAGIDPRGLRYLLIVGWGPPLTLLPLSLFVGIGEAWATPMYCYSGLILVLLFGRMPDAVILRRLALAAVIFVVGWSGAYSASVAVAGHVRGKFKTVLLPQAEMSARMGSIWQQATGGMPLRIVAGDSLLAMVTGLSAPGRPSIYTDFDPVKAPWITPERISREGMLIVWTGENPPAGAVGYLKGAERGSETFLWSRSKKAWPLVLNYAIVKPAG